MQRGMPHVQSTTGAAAGGMDEAKRASARVAASESASPSDWLLVALHRGPSPVGWAPLAGDELMLGKQTVVSSRPKR